MPLTLIGDKSRRDQPLLECYLLSARVNRVVIRVRTGWILGSKASEALTNVHRHSGSRTAGIALTRDANSATLEIRDQGCGIPPGVIETAEGEVSRLGVGIAGMREDGTAVRREARD